MESTIGQRIRQLREAKQLSVADFAAAAGVKPSAIYGLESNANKPSIETVGALRLAFPDLNTEWLQFGSGEMLRDGRALTPAPKPTVAEEPAPRFTTAADTVEEASAIVRLARTEAENEQLRERLEDAKAEITWLRGKSTPSSYAATEAVEPLKMRRWHDVAAQTPKQEGKQLFMDPAFEPSDRAAA